MKINEIRERYIEFFTERGHTQIPRANLVPKEDPTTLFTGSGMQPLLPYLLGDSHPEGTRLVNSQPCFRAEDIDEIGDNRHTTFFEMLGNWSLGDYFKEEQLKWFFTFLVEELELEPENLYTSAFIGNDKYDIPRDEEAAKIWQELFAGHGIEAEAVELGSAEQAAQKGMQGGRIFYYDEAENWWSRVGAPDNMPEGEPGGPDSEVFYRFEGVEHDTAYGEYCHPACECGQFLEIGNSVFMQYQKTEDGFKELPQKNVDFGGGLERLAAATTDTPDVFLIDAIEPVISQLEELSGQDYEDKEVAMRVIADHLRSAVFMAVDGLRPGNNESQYVMRRVIRRAIRQALNLGLEEDVMQQLAPVVVESYQEAYPEVGNRSEEVMKALTKEEDTFRKTLNRGLKELRKMIDTKAPGEESATPLILSGRNIFYFYDTLGFPPELLLEEVQDERKVRVSPKWREEFDEKMQEQKERSRQATKGKFEGGLASEEDIHKKYHTATHLLYKALVMVLGDHVTQRGSNITSERLRFDFSHPSSMTDEEIAEVEDIVNQQIENDLEVSFEEMPLEEAMESEAFGAFGERYPDRVKVYSMVNPETDQRFSFEICGGPHVDHTAQLAEGGKEFKITKEKSSSSGVRRVKAVLG